MVMLTSISNDAINDNLKKRFSADLIYVPPPPAPLPLALPSLQLNIPFFLYIGVTKLLIKFKFILFIKFKFADGNRRVVGADVHRARADLGEPLQTNQQPLHREVRTPGHLEPCRRCA
jgi:hypothetical protein